MTKQEIQQATSIAMDSKVELSGVDISVFNGFGLPDFKPVRVTIRQIARLIRWQAVMFNGELDADMYNKVADAGRRKFMVCG